MTERPLVFVDCETTGLNSDLHDVWEIALILRRIGRADAEYAWMVRPDLTSADPQALEVGGFYERYYDFMGGEDDPVGAGRVTSSDHSDLVGLETDARTIAHEVADLLVGAVVVGVNPSFDQAFLSRWLQRHGHVWAAHYRTIDVTTLGAGVVCGRAGALPVAPGDAHCPPYSSQKVSLSLGVEPRDFARHTALGDARWARAQYDAVTGAAS